MPRKRVVRPIRTVYLPISGITSQEATDIEADFRGRLRDGVWWKDFWDRVDQAVHLYRCQARLRRQYTDTQARLTYVERARHALSPRTRLARSRAHLEEAINRTGAMPWEHVEFPSLPRVRIARRIAARATADYPTYRAFLAKEAKHLKASLRVLGTSLGKPPGKGRPPATPLVTLLDTLRNILTSDLKTPFRWCDIVMICDRFRPVRLTPQQDPHFEEFLDHAFLFPTPEDGGLPGERLRRVWTHRP